MTWNLLDMFLTCAGASIFDRLLHRKKAGCEIQWVGRRAIELYDFLLQKFCAELPCFQNRDRQLIFESHIQQDEMYICRKIPNLKIYVPYVSVNATPSPKTATDSSDRKVGNSPT
jgi:hypothetical protein